MEKKSAALFHSLFTLNDDVSEQEFLTAFEAFYDHLVAAGFARGYRIMRRQPLEGFGKSLSEFQYHAEIEFPSLAEDQACYEYVKRSEEPIRSLHRAMNSKAKSGSADFFLEVRIGQHP